MPRSDAASRVFKYRGAREFRDTGPRVKRGVTKYGGFPTCGRPPFFVRAAGLAGPSRFDFFIRCEDNT